MVFKSLTRRLPPQRVHSSKVLAFAAGALALWATPHSASATSFRTLYSFCADYPQCTSGESPDSLVVGTTGNLYGTTFGDLASVGGTVFEISPRGKLRTLYRFCKHGLCPDGLNPAGLIADVNGNLYGTTRAGGAYGEGVVFQLQRDQATGTWRQVVLHSFCRRSGCSDGQTPIGLSYKNASAGVLYDGISPLFGRVRTGGAHGKGGIFELSFKAGAPTFRLVYSFCSLAGCADGDGQYADNALTVISNSTLFGAARGGSANSGVVFELDRNGKSFTETVLYTFCQQSNCSDGAFPNSVKPDGQGNLVGTTLAGGSANSGTIFSLSPNGSTSQERVLYNFCSESNCADGRNPEGPLQVSADGILYGTTSAGGSNNFDGGTIFSFSSGAERVLYNVCSLQFCADGSEPIAQLTPMGKAYYGATLSGGVSGLGGTIFKLMP